MDGTNQSMRVAAATLGAVPAEVVLQSVLFGRTKEVSPLFWRSPTAEATGAVPAVDNGTALVIPTGTSVSFDTYFGALFEYHWRLRTRLRTLVLRLDLVGEARIRVWRRVPHARDALLLEQTVSGAIDLSLPPGPAHARQGGLVWFDVVASTPVILHAACWITPDSEATTVGLGVAICTFNREAELAAVLAGIAGCPELAQSLARVIVVNQGRPRLADQPALIESTGRLGARLRIIEQSNFGGAGGFGRGLLEAMEDDAVTHVCFLDDDVVLEPDCLARMSAFFSLAHDKVAVGGHMLDAVQPTILYEAGAIVRNNWTLQPLSHGLDLENPGVLTGLLETQAMHYNGWWMFGFPKSLVEDLGMPLPCFIRGDDVEFGLRLHNRGVFTVSLPGVAVWHEPFYLKLGGWQLYYETRNALICAALHQDFTPHRVALQLAKRLLTQLLTYRYYNAALIVRAIEDFLRGPSLLECDPNPLHASLSELRDAYPQAWTRRETVLCAAPVGRSPKQIPGFLLAMLVALARNWLRPTAASVEPASIWVGNLVWFRVLASDNLAVDTYWDAQLPTYRRDRTSFRRLLVTGTLVIWRMFRTAPVLQRDVAEATPALTSLPFWRQYLRLDPR